MKHQGSLMSLLCGVCHWKMFAHITWRARGVAVITRLIRLEYLDQGLS